MTTKLPDGLRGVDHVAYVTRKPKETLHFYRDILGLPLAHCIMATGWGRDPHPDFCHFFFDVGGGAKIAFFYYMADAEGDLHGGPGLLDKARHLAMLVDTEEELDAYEQRFAAAAYPLRHRVMHEVIESIYAWDPNGYNIEISRPLRPLDADDEVDATFSLQALIDVIDESGSDGPTIEQVWRRKGELIGSDGAD